MGPARLGGPEFKVLPLRYAKGVALARAAETAVGPLGPHPGWQQLQASRPIGVRIQAVV
jgi:hypothetical protein